MTLDVSIFSEKNVPKVPYPGLRPFAYDESIDESIIFKGRDWQSENLLRRLSDSHLVAVLGPSGCGKSSLVLAGLIPRLESGDIYVAGGDWCAASMRPGKIPIRSLAEALANELEVEEECKDELIEEFYGQLCSSPTALISIHDAYGEKLGSYTNLLIVVDQFEEIFREDMAEPGQAKLLIDLILSVFHARPERLYIVITMRTDYLEQCALFMGLPDALNSSLYICPRLDDKELKEAIEKPAELYGGKVEPALTERIITDMSVALGYDADRLPLMQHALLQLWRSAQCQAATNGNTDDGNDVHGPVLRLQDYLDMDGLVGALDKHADDIHSNLSADQQNVAEIMFRLLSDRQDGDRYQRRITSKNEILDVFGKGRAAEPLLESVIEDFASEESSFIRPIDGGEGWDITHECLIRKWNQLRGWADHEAESAEDFLELTRQARLYEEGKRDRLGPRQIQSYQDWFRTRRPTRAWAQRYEYEPDGGDFELATDFLEKSHRASFLRLFIAFPSVAVTAVAFLAAVYWGGGEIYFKYFEAGQLARIHSESTELIQHGDIKDKDLSLWAQAQVKTGRWDAAEKVLKEIEILPIRSQAAGEFARLLAIQTGQMEAARRVAGIISDDRLRSQALEEIARTLAEVERFVDARAVAMDISEPQIRDDALSSIAEALVKAKQFDEARAIADTVVDLEGKERIFRFILGGLARVGRWQEARALLDKISDPHLRQESLRRIADVLLELGRFDEALKVAEDLSEPQERDRVLAISVDGLASAHEFEEAKGVAAQIESSYAMDWAKRKLAIALADASRLHEAEQTAKSIRSRDSSDRAFMAIARGYADLGQFQKVQRIIKAMDRPSSRWRALVEWAGGLAKANRVGEALKIAQAIQLEEFKVSALTRIGRALVEAGRFEEAKNFAMDISELDISEQILGNIADELVSVEQFGEARRFALEISEPNLRDQILRNIADALVSTEQFNEAHELTKDIVEPNIRDQTLRQIAEELAEVKRFEQARTIAMDITEPQIRDDALSVIAMSLVEAEQSLEAWEVAADISERVTKDRSLRNIGFALTKAESFKEARTVAEDISDPKQKHDVIASIVRGLAEVGRIDEAQELTGKIDDVSGRDKALASLACERVKSGALAEAIGIVQDIRNDSNRLGGYSLVLIAWIDRAKRGLSEQARCAEGAGVARAANRRSSW